jgi:hypothetical protein
MPERHQLAGKLASSTRHHGSESPQAQQYKRDLAAIQIEDFVRKTVDAAPPLTAEQRARIAALLTPGPGGDAG